MKFFYIAIGENGKRVKGFVEATDKGKAALYLRERSLIPIRIENHQQQALAIPISLIQRVSKRDIVFFTRQIATMLMSGLTLTQSLEILKNQVQKQNMIPIVETIITNIEEGKSFSEALSQFPNIFSPIYISLIRASEAAGLLDKVMLRLADSLEKQYALQSKIKAALVYPIIVVTLMIAVTIIMMLFVIPQLSSLYSSLNLQMPLPTRIVIGISDIVSKYFLIVFVVMVCVFLYFNKWRRSDGGKNIIDRFVLQIPVFGTLIRYSLLTEFSRTFGLLVGTGALVIEGLTKSADVMGNVLYKRAVLKVAENVEKGVSIGDAMNKNTLFPPILVEMVKIGEQTGKLDDSLMRVSEYFERESEQIVQTLTAAIEPFIMIALALGVGFLIISIITPIYNLLSAFQ
jgi:type IV pilus assembly protein PilC